MLRVNAVDHIVLNVRDVEVSAAWYETVLGMERKVARPSSGGEPRTSLTFGHNKINLRPMDTPQESWFTADMPCIGSADLCFLTEADPDEVLAHLRQCGVEIITGPVTKQGAQGPLLSIYVRDPDGSLIEVSSHR